MKHKWSSFLIILENRKIIQKFVLALGRRERLCSSIYLYSMAHWPFKTIAVLQYCWHTDRSCQDKAQGIWQNSVVRFLKVLKNFLKWPKLYHFKEIKAFVWQLNNCSVVLHPYAILPYCEGNHHFPVLYYNLLLCQPSHRKKKNCYGDQKLL